MEDNLELVGAIGVEDKLQDGVKDTLVALGQAGIKVKPSFSSHSKPRMRHLKRFVLITLFWKTKHLRSLIQDIVQGFEWLEMLDYCNAINQRTIICHKCCWIFLCFILVYFCSVRSEFLKRDIWNWNIKGYLPRGIERGWGGKSPCSLHLYSMGPRNSVPSLKKLKLAEFMDN